MKDVADGQATKIFIPNDLTHGVEQAVMMGAGVSAPAKTSPRAQYRAEKLNHAARQAAADEACMDGDETRASAGAAAENFKNESMMQ